MTSDSHKFLPDCSKARILVIGDVMLDRYLYGSAHRISPEAPVPVVKIEDKQARAGGAANVAVNVASLGAQVTLIGLVGEDEDADCLSKLVFCAGVKPDFIECRNAKTIVKSRVMSSGQQLMRLDFEDDKNLQASQEVIKKFEKYITSVDAVIFSDYAKGCLAEIEKLIAIAKAHKKNIFVDPKGIDFSRYKGATVITPNMQEFENVAGQCCSDDDILEKARRMQEQLDIDCLLITKGEHGITIVEKDQFEHLVARTHEVYDVTGAGDTVVSVFAVMVTSGKTFSTAAQLANQAAGLVVQKLGTATIDLSEFSRYGDKSHSICDQKTLLKNIDIAKKRKQRIVMTNGCFDILHAGHIAYLEQAATYGDRLVVAINDDVSVKQLKGDKRPINKLANRMQLVAALAVVDWVVAFSEETPEELIVMLSPNVLVKGGDYTENQIAGAEHVRKNGGDVIILDYIDGLSTTNMINNILN